MPPIVRKNVTSTLSGVVVVAVCDRRIGTRGYGWANSLL
jgi:hypothetical protein